MSDNNLKSALQEALDYEKNQFIEQSKREIGTIYDQLMQYNRIPESLFRNYFLDFFLGYKQSDTWVYEWISIANSPLAKVIVFDDTTNQDLFVVPSLFNTDLIRSKNTNRSLQQIMSQYSYESNNIKEVADAKLFNNLNGYAREILASSDKSDEELWYRILRGYNLLSQEDSMQNKTDSSLDDFIDE